MKKKIDVIWCCHSCSHCDAELGEPLQGYCIVMSTPLDDISELPGWCPLEDYTEKIEGEK